MTESANVEHHLNSLGNSGYHAKRTCRL